MASVAGLADPPPHLAELAVQLAAATAERDVHLALHAAIARVAPANGILLSRYDPASRTRACVYAHSDGKPVDVGTLPVLPLNDSPNSRAIQTRRTVIVDDYVAATKGSPVTWVGRDVEPERPRSSLAVPILAAGEVIGLVTVQAMPPNAYHEEHARAVEAVTALAALRLHALQLEQENRRLRDAAGGPRAPAEPASAVARALVRRMLGAITRDATHRARRLRELGAEVALAFCAKDPRAAADAYADMGLGEVRFDGVADGRYTFTAWSLLEREHSSLQPTCFLCLGFLEGVIADLEGAPALGAEVACQSRGAPECRFVVAARHSR